jgi:hypothetical protein
MPIAIFDLHNHLVEKKLDPNEWWHAVQAKDINVIAITEHVEYDPIRSYQPLADIQPENIVLIPGMELNTSVGHVVALSKNPDLYEIDALMEIGIPIEKAIEIADKEKITLSLAHPWGFKYDSAFHHIGDEGIEKLIKNFPQVGVEAYNGMIGHVSFLAFDSNWVNKPQNWFEYLQTNRVARKTRLDKLGTKIKKKFDSKMVEIIEKSGNAMELGEKARFVTAGSDAHLIDQIGTGIMKMKLKSIPTTPAEALKVIREQKQAIVWIGPYVWERENGQFEIERVQTTKKHLLEAASYATKDFVMRKTHTKEKIEKIREKLRDRKRAKRKKAKAA